MENYAQIAWRQLEESLKTLAPASQTDAIEVRSRISYYCFLLREQFFQTHLERWLGDGWFQKVGPGICNTMACALMTKIWEDPFLRNHINGRKMQVFNAGSVTHEWLIVQHGSGTQWILDASGAQGVLFDTPEFVAAFTKSWGDMRFKYIDRLEDLIPIQDYWKQFEQ